MTERNGADESNLLARITELQERLAVLEQTGGAQPVTQVTSIQDQPIGRRALLRRVGTVAAGAAAVSAVGGMFRPAAAGVGTGQNLQIGFTNLGTSPSPQTLLKVSNLASGENAIFAVTDGASASPSRRAAIAGLAGSQLDTGVAGVSTGSDGIGVLGQGHTALLAASNNTHIKLLDAAGQLSAYPSTASVLARAGNVGQIVFDSSQNLWLGTGTTTSAWRKLGGPATAGSLHVIAPSRVYDSRPIGKLNAGSNRVVQVTGVGGIPAGAQAILATLTLTNTDTSFGFLTMTGGSVATTAASSINWFGVGQTLATTVVSNLNPAGQIKMFNNSPAGANTDFIVDITGYYL